MSPGRRPLPGDFANQNPIFDRSDSNITEIADSVFQKHFLTKLILFRNQISNIPSGKL